MFSSDLMVIRYFSISRGGAILIPLETDSPLVADANAPLALFFIL